MKKICLNSNIFKEICDDKIEIEMKVEIEEKEEVEIEKKENKKMNVDISNIKEIFDVVFKFLCFFSALFLFGFKMIDFCCNFEVVQKFPTLQFFPYIIMALSMTIICFLLIYGYLFVDFLNEKKIDSIYEEILSVIVLVSFIFFMFFMLMSCLENLNHQICKDLIDSFNKNSNEIIVIFSLLMLVISISLIILIVLAVKKKIFLNNNIFIILFSLLFILSFLTFKGSTLESLLLNYNKDVNNKVVLTSEVIINKKEEFILINNKDMKASEVYWLGR